jgi:type IV secretion system protein VirD4
MYALPRLMFIGVFGLFAYCAVVLCIQSWLGLLVLGLAIGAILKRRSRSLTALGSARFADRTELQARGMFGNRGMILGRVPVPPFRERMRALFSRLPPNIACREFLGRDRVVRYVGVHWSIFAPTRSGKGVSLIIPFLKTCRDSVVAIDLKGELAKLTARARRWMGQKVVILDPYHIVSKKSDCLNPLDLISASDPEGFSKCQQLAAAMVFRTGQESEPHWNDRAEQWIQFAIAVVVVFGNRDRGTRNLQVVLDILSRPERMKEALEAAAKCDAWDEALQRLAGQLSFSKGDELSSTLSTVSRQISFLNDPLVMACLSKSTVDASKIRNGYTFYLVLPPQYATTRAGLLRLWISSLMGAVVAGGLNERQPVHFVLDEAASLGHMELVESAIDKYAGYGLRLIFVFQNLGQLKKCFPVDGGQGLRANSTQIFFAVNDYETAKGLSDELGVETIEVEGRSANTGSSTSYGPHNASGNHSFSHGKSFDVKQQARELVKPDEIRAMSPRTAITLIPGLRPVVTQLVRYYEEKRLFRRSVFFEATKALEALFAAAWLLLIAWLVASQVGGFKGGFYGGFGGAAVQRHQEQPWERAP